jgi:LemA protein
MSGMYDQGEATDQREQFRREFESDQSKKRSKSFWFVGAVVGVLLLFLILGGSACATYNSLTAKRERVRTEFSNVDAQLQRRSDLINNLVETVKGYTKHEEQVFSEIAQARSRLLSASTVQEKSDSSDQLNSALGRLLVLAENYPDLKASGQFTRLQDEIAGTENRIAVARRDYNNAVQEYNTARQRFPSVLLAGTLGFERADPFKAEAGAREAPKVKF